MVVMNLKNYKMLPELDPEALEREKYSLLFETGSPDENNTKTYYFSRPLQVLSAYDLPGLKRVFRKIESYSKKYYLAGYLSYEAGYYFEKEIFRPAKKSTSPLLKMFVFDRVASFDHQSGKTRGTFPFSKSKTPPPYKLDHLRPVVKFDRYKRNIEKIKNYIEKGDTYQVNYTSKLKFNFTGNSYSLYRELKKKQSVSFGAYLNLGCRKILSLSPELFFSLGKNILKTKPMKGTISRGRNLLEDRQLRAELKTGAKNRAENIMIVDMLRNDLGRICKTGSVKTSKIFEIERYSTLFQMVSTVTGRLLPGRTYFDIFKSIFPGGSITGAPKIRTMEIIRSLEKEPRGLYCGALGIIFPGKKKAVFNIPIRTVVLEKKRGELGIGGGILWDSSAAGEYQELLLKAKFLAEKYADFSLVETMLWSDGYFLLSRHLKRLRDSADYFSFPLFTAGLKEKLKQLEKTFRDGSRYRIRMLLSSEGKLKFETTESGEAQGPSQILVSKIRTNSKDRFLYHKTTNRQLYEAERKKVEAAGAADIIFLNEKGEVTEGAISNIFIVKNGRYYTPPLGSGLLPGVYRAYYMKKKKAVEKALFLKDLKTADRIILTNSVRKAREVRLPYHV